MGLSLFASRQNALLFSVKHLKKKTFQCKTCPVLLFASACRVGGSFFFTFVGLRYSKIRRPGLQTDFSTQKIASKVEVDEMSVVEKFPAKKWFAMGICKSDQVEKVFQRICLLLVRGFRRLSTRERERGRQKLRWDHRRKEQSLWKNVETHTLGLVGREKEVAKEKSKPTPENFSFRDLENRFFSFVFLPPTSSHSLTPAMSKNQKKECLRIFFWKKKHQPAQLCVQRWESKRILFEKRRGFSFLFNSI